MNMKKSVFVGLAALGLLTISTNLNAHAKSYAKVTSNKALTSSKSSRNVTFTGRNALATKAGTLKGAKQVASTTTLKKLAASKHSQNNFYAYRVATTNQGAVYYKVVSFDHHYSGWIYGGKSTAKFAGGVKAYTTFKENTPSAADQANSYQLATTGNRNDGTQLTYKAPMWTQFQVGRNLINSTGYFNDVLKITKQGVRSRENDTWVYVQDTTNPKASGWIKKSALKIYGAVPASQGVTINFVEHITGKKVGSVVIPFKNNTGKGTMSLLADNSSAIRANMPSGYTSYDLVYGVWFKDDSLAKSQPKGSSNTVYVDRGVDKTGKTLVAVEITDSAKNSGTLVAYDQITQPANASQKLDEVKNALQGTVGDNIPVDTIYQALKAQDLDKITVNGQSYTFLPSLTSGTYGGEAPVNYLKD